jgi:hypothetical protein
LEGGGPRKQARIIGQSSNGHVLAESDPAEWWEIYDAFQEQLDIIAQEVVLHQDMLDTYAPKSSANQTQIARWERHAKERQYYPRAPYPQQGPGGRQPAFFMFGRGAAVFGLAPG